MRGTDLLVICDKRTKNIFYLVIEGKISYEGCKRIDSPGARSQGKDI